MDCRKLLVPALALLPWLAGCHHEGALVHKPETYVALGDFKAQAGFAKETSPEQQRLSREEARQAYREALAVDPKHLPAYVGLARLSQAAGDEAAAAANYAKALELNDKDAGLWFSLGMCQCRQKNWSGAADSLGKAVERAPDNRQYVNTLGFTLARAGRASDSLTCLARVNGEAGAHLQLARVLRHMNQRDQAREQVALALQKDPNLPAARTLLAELDGRTADVQTVSHTEVKPVTPDPAAPGLLPPPPEIRKEATATPSSPGKPIPVPPLPVLSGQSQP